jgi:hypothetical protein
MITSGAGDRHSSADQAASTGVGRWWARTVLYLAVAGSVVALTTNVLPRLIYWPESSEQSVQPEEMGGSWSLQKGVRQVDVLFLGNSLLGYGIDVEGFARRSGRTADALWAVNSASGWWYLALDRFVAETEHRPGLVVLCFSDDWLTKTWLMGGDHELDRMVALLDAEDRRAGRADRVAESAHSDVFVFLERHWPLVAIRMRVRGRVESAIKGYIASMSGRSLREIDGSLQRTFDLVEKDSELQDRREAAQPVDLRLYDFDRVKQQSFLPDLLDLASAEHIPIVFLRMPRKETPSRRADTPAEIALRRYIADLDHHLTERGFTLLDLSEIDGLTPESFSFSDHLNASGTADFMPVLEAALQPFLPLPAPSASR